MSAPAKSVAIIGGGIAGLAAAYELQQRGIRASVFEAGPQPGGVIATERFDGWVVDGGPDALLVQKPAAIELCRELGIAGRLVSTLPPRTAYVLRDGRLHPLVEGSFLGFPLKLGGLARSSLFTWRGKLRMALEAVVPRGDTGEDESIAAFVRRRFGEEAVEYLAEPLLAGIHAGDVDRLSVRALFPRLVEAERGAGSVIRSLRTLSVRPSPRGAFVSFPGGMAELVEALSRALHPGVLHLSSQVLRLHRAGSYTVEFAGGTMQADAVILAVPAYVAAHLVRSLDMELAGLCDAVPYASTAVAAFGYRRDQVRRPMQGSGFVVPRVERSPLLAATWVSSKWPDRAPADHTLLRAFLGGGRDPHRLDGDDATLLDTARGALARIMDIAGEPLFTRLFRLTRQSPQYEVGHLDRLAAIDARLSEIPGLFLTGSGFRGIGIPDSIADARHGAARIAAYLAGRATP